MAITETLRPTVATETAPTLTDGANGYDGDTGTFARVAHATEGQQAGATFDGWSDGSIPTNKRQSIVLDLYLTWGTGDANDSAAVYARAKATDPWSLLGWDKYPGTFTGWVQYDVTDLIGTEPLSSMDVQVTFYNGGTGDPDDPPPVLS